MIYEERLLKVLYTPCFSEKASFIMKKNNTLILKVAQNATKKEIKTAVQKLFEVDVTAVNTLLVKGKTKRYKKYLGRRNNWKKAFITFKKGQSLNFDFSTK